MFVGGFVGDPPMNFLRMQVEGGLVRLGTLTLTPPTGVSDTVTLGVRPEDLEVTREGKGFAFRVQVPEPLGPQVLLTGDAEGQSLRVTIPPDRVVHAGETVIPAGEGMGRIHIENLNVSSQLDIDAAMSQLAWSLRRQSA